MHKGIQEKYTFKKKLGKGSYGEVFLAQNKQNEYVALKTMMLEDMDERTRANLDGEIRCMRQINSKYVVKMFDQEEDENYIYLVCEYCEGGDLFNYQASKSGRRFKLEEAALILSHVIRGLEDLHKKKYLHRDIKSQNILVKRQKDGNQIFKLADMGFSKQIDQTCKTVLGTQKFMAPEVFDWDRQYGYQVDMWALGVVLFFMLNAEYPFNMSPHLILQRKYQQLCKLADKFSYSEAVSKTKAKDTSTCNKDTQDLFRKIFQVNQDKRITFPEIRVHPVFKKYFKEGNEDSKITYKKNLAYSSSMIKSLAKGDQKNRKPINKNKVLHPSIILHKNKNPNQNFHKEKTIIKGWNSQLKFLTETSIELINYSEGILSIEEVISARYCILKLYLILLKELKNDRISHQNLQKNLPKIQWTKFCQSKDYENFKHYFNSQFQKSELQLSNLFTDCQKSIDSISKFNNNLKNYLQTQISQQKSGKDFTKVYRAIIRRCFEKFENKKDERKINLNMAVNLLICFIFDQLMVSSDADLLNAFKPYVNQRKNSIVNGIVDLQDVRSWIQTSNKENIFNLFDSITGEYFKSS